MIDKVFPKIHNEGYKFLVIFGFATLILYLISGFLGLIGLVLTIWVYYFFRDPERVIINDDNYLVLDCYRLIDPADATSVFNDWFIKKYLTALIKKQWGQNLIKFQGVALPGGVQLNGRQLYDDAVAELEVLERELRTTYEEPPFDLIG